MRPWSVAVVLLGGCARVFAFTEVPPPGDGSGSGSGSGSACAATSPSDDFTGTIPCQGWGQVVSDPQVVVQSGSGLLRVVIGTQGGVGGCAVIGAIVPTGSGIFVEVPSPLDTGTAYTVLHAFAQNPGEASATMLASGGNVVLYDENAKLVTSPPVPDSLARWWRLRPEDGGIAGDVSGDGTSWTRVGLAPGVVGPVQVFLQAGVTTANDPIGVASFAHFDVCP